jgi:CRISPR/Cas system-associated exonuclease Cas4 (RecB family)
MCEQQFFFEYVLGWRGPSGFKAVKGTIMHKVLELLAIIKKAQQDNLTHVVDDEILGQIDVNNYKLNVMIEKVYKYYSEANSHHTWTVKDYKECYNWVYKAIEFNNGMFDPRNCTILQPEQRFDLIIEKPWAKYEYNIDGKIIDGYLGLKGTIDLITTVDDKTVEVVDYKSGKRLDWATGQEKTQEKLEKDAQLRIYHYAVKKLYPHIDTVIFTIYYVNDGGPFSMVFHDSDLAETENMLRKKFEIIKNSRRPKLNKSWMCNKLCHFGKTTFENSIIEPQIEYRDGQTCQKGSVMSKCEQVKHDLELYGIDATMDIYKNPDHTIGHYQAPGAT